ncbi:sodium:calcium antiporter [Candidatus Woesearchaeota archaeon]|nr:sodium:calcium antiporter [Candidatus Woesearchaeota archaeon]
MPLVTDIIILVASALVLAKSGTSLVSSISKLARFLRVSEYTVSFVIMAFATSIPELFIGILSAINKTPELSLGNVIGANIANVTLVIGIVSLLGRNIKIKDKIIFRDSFYMLIIAVIPILLMIDHTLSRFDGLLLLIMFFIYVYVLMKNKIPMEEDEKDIKYTEIFKNVGIFLLSILLLLGSAQFLVKSAQSISVDLNVPVLLVGLFIVSIGTTLPELVFDTRAVLMKHKEQALGNTIGSVIVNSTAVLGTAALITPITSQFTLFFISASFMIFSLFLFMTFIRSNNGLTWREGIVLLMVYLLFVIVEVYIQGLPNIS